MTVSEEMCVSEPTGAGGVALLSAPALTVGDRLQQASDRAAYLSVAARGLSGALRTDRAVDLVLEMLTGQVVDWAQMTVRDGRHYSFRARLAEGGVHAASLPVGAVEPSSSLGRVVATGASDLVMVPDGEHSDPALASAVPAQPLRDALATIRPVDMLTIALRARGTTYGALTVALRGGTGFDEAAVAFLEDFAQRVSVTLDTTRALADSRRVARVLSRDLNPPALPTLSGVESATYYRVAFEHEALGGDFYDVHGDPDDWTAVMGDVCGKGVEAAVLTGKVRQTVRTGALVDRDPAWILELTNRVLLADGEDTFVTMVCARGRLVGDTVHLEVATAGHPAPLVVRADGSVEQPVVTGTALGLLPGTPYASVPVDLAPGETCLFHTDGVTEASGHRGRFGDDRLRRVLVDTGACDVRAQVESVAVAVSAHLRDRAHDDIAILALQAGGER